MDIKEVAQALELKKQDPDDGRFDIGEFAEAIISAYKAELLKEVGEPVAYLDDNSEYVVWSKNDQIFGRYEVFTSDQVAAAVAKATKPLEEEIERLKRERLITADAIESMHSSHKDQLAKAEQRVAEAIVDMLQQKHRNCFGAHSFYLAASVATANGEWRKFLKEV